MTPPTFFFIKKKKIKKKGRERTKGVKCPPEPHQKYSLAHRRLWGTPAMHPHMHPRHGGTPPPDRAGEDHAPPQPPALDQVQCSGAAAGREAFLPAHSAIHHLDFGLFSFFSSHYFCPINSLAPSKIYFPNFFIYICVCLFFLKTDPFWHQGEGS